MYPFDKLHQFSLNRAVNNLSDEEQALWKDLITLKEKLNFPSLQADVGALLNWMIPFQGKNLNVFEFGSGFGHSSFWYFAKNKSPYINTVQLTERRDDLEQYFRQLNWPDEWKNKMSYHHGDGMVYLEQQTLKYDLALIDGQKSSYHDCLVLLSKKLNPGGLVLIDNMFWKGQILEETGSQATRSLIELHRFLKYQDNLEILFLPIADGVSLLRKKFI